VIVVWLAAFRRDGNDASTELRLRSGPRSSARHFIPPKGGPESAGWRKRNGKKKEENEEEDKAKEQMRAPRFGGRGPGRRKNRPRVDGEQKSGGKKKRAKNPL